MIKTATELDSKRATETTVFIGKRIPKLDAPEKATGLARYIEDITLPRMLYGKIFFADRPHARIVNIDTSAAESMPGVRAVITAASRQHRFEKGQSHLHAGRSRSRGR